MPSFARPLTSSQSTRLFEPVERVSNRLVGASFSPHRHDTYTFAVTLAGVQAFNYRGRIHYSLPGQVLILHPDELHDGFCHDEAGFSYRAAYLPPAHLQAVTGNKGLPYIADRLWTHPALVAAALKMVIDCAEDNDPAAYDDALYDLAQAMNHAVGRACAVTTADLSAVMMARAYLDASVVVGARLDELEAATGCDRWQLSRDFRTVLGTSPYRYLQHRRIDLAKRLLRGGATLAEAAHGAGFADQSHFSRTFRKTVGLTPKVWLRSGLFRTIVL